MDFLGMIPVSRAIRRYLYPFCLFVFALNLSIQHVDAADHEIVGEEPLPTANDSGNKEQTLIVGTTSTETFNSEDVYRIELSMDVPSNIDLIATESKSITVTLEKQARATNTEQDTLIRTYLDSIAVTGGQNDSTLQLKVQLPSNSPEEPSNESSNIGDLHATLYNRVQLKCTIKTPADVSVKLQAKAGNISLQRIRGEIEVTMGVGDVHLDETLGNYNISVAKGDIDGKILLTRGQNKLATQNGSIGLVVLDPVAAPMDITAEGGSIRLQLPETYAADIEFESEKQQIVINLPAQIDDESGLTIVNDGGPLLRLKATNAISLLPSSQSDKDKLADAELDPFADVAQSVPQIAQSPVIDGNLSEIVWQTAGALSPFQNPNGTGAPKNLTETFLMWDAENLYIGVKAYVFDFYLLYVSQTQHDSPIWEDECIEILIDPNPKTDIYHHLVINPIGAYFDQRVDTPGEPNFRFAPRDVQITLDRTAMQTSFNADREWNSEIEVATQINTTFWSLEIALPRKMLEASAKIDSQSTSSFENRWLFNVHRKMYTRNTKSLIPATTREYSYWQPIYDDEYPWWPHSPQEYVGALSGRYGPAMGFLEFVTMPPTSEDFAPEARFKVAAIEIKGNTKIPTEVIQKFLPVQPEDIITLPQLSWLIAELRERGWFQEVRLETQQIDVGEEPVSDQQETEMEDRKSERGGTQPSNLPTFQPSVNLHIQVTEAPGSFAQEIKIKGNRSFPSQFIKDWFQLKPGYLAAAVVELKQLLIADFYLNRGYEFATVEYQFVDNILEFNINEGALHEVRFTGNTRISEVELLSALDLKIGVAGERDSQTSDVYHRTLGQSKINRMSKELSEKSAHFKSVRNWRVQREGGKNVMIIDIEEQPFARHGGFPIVQFNRVHGLMLGAGGTLATQLTGREQVFGSISGGFASKIWNYQFGIEQGFSKRQLLKLGGSLYKLTDVSSNVYLHHGDATLSATYYGAALQDYYQRLGAQGWITYAPTQWSYLRLEFTGEKHDNLSKSTDWSYLNRNQLKRGNARIDRGQMRNLSLVFGFDTRDHKSTSTRHFHTLFSANERTRRGWRGQFAIEVAGQRFGGDYAFNFYRFEVARYTPLSGPHHLNVRVAGDFSDAPLPRQRLLHLGGGNTLRGHNFNAFAGDSRLLLNLEYRLIKETILSDQDIMLGWSLSCFLDTGSVWWYDEVPFSDFEDFMTRLKTSIGIGGSVFADPFATASPWSLGVEVAGPLDSSFSLRSPIVILRLDRIF